MRTERRDKVRRGISKSGESSEGGRRETKKEGRQKRKLEGMGKRMK